MIEPKILKFIEENPPTLFMNDAGDLIGLVSYPWNGPDKKIYERGMNRMHDLFQGNSRLHDILVHMDDDSYQLLLNEAEIVWHQREISKRQDKIHYIKSNQQRS